MFSLWSFSESAGAVHFTVSTLCDVAHASHQTARSLLKSIQKNFGTLPFCRRYLDHIGEKNYLLAVGFGDRLR